MPAPSPELQRLLDEALVLNDDLESLVAEGLEAFRGANAVVRAFVGKMVRDGTGMSLEALRDEVHGKTVLLAALTAGETPLADAQSALGTYRYLVEGTVRFVEGLEPMAQKRIKKPEARERVTAIARVHLESARRLVAVLGELAER